MTIVTGAVAARRLGVTVRQVQRLVRAGDLDAIGPDRLDGDSVARLAAERSGRHGRSWSEATAWGAVALLGGDDAPWLGASQRSRLRATLARISSADLVARTRNRAVVHRLRGHPAAIARVAAEVVVPGAHRELDALTADPVARLDGYVAADRLAELSRRFLLSRDERGNFTLRATSMDLGVVERLAAGPVLAALDLSTSHDERERTAALARLARVVEGFGG